MTDPRVFRPPSHPIARYGVAYPLLSLVALYLLSSVVGFSAGNIVFLLSIPVALVWVVVGLVGRRLAASLPTFELLFDTASKYGKEDPEETTDRIPRGAVALFYLTGVVAFGWVGLVASVFLFG